ncbi:hypothetical protein [Lentzea sp. E54]|uniref:hypothetical protein n=1 Tax=Lentzea xerophila TaxID=3435883 RepID=UPI003DA6A4B6
MRGCRVADRRAANARSAAAAITPGAVAGGGSDRSGTLARMIAEASSTSTAVRACCSAVSYTSERACMSATVPGGGEWS